MFSGWKFVTHFEDMGYKVYTLREERRFQEAPAAYKPVQPVIEAQIQAGLVSPVVRLKPLVTFKQ